jgi:hypothetical protein
MLLARIGRIRARRERTHQETWPLLFEFLHISSILEDDSGIEMLLWFLDDGYHLSYDWEDTLAILTRPKRLVEALQRGPGRRNPAEQAVDGFRKFLGFCVALDDLLARSSQFPLFRAAIWHYHAYWFRTKKGKVRKALEAAFTAFQRWSSSPSAKQLSEAQRTALEEEAARSLWSVRQIVRRISGTSYGGILTRDQQRIRRDSARATKILVAGRVSRAPARYPVPIERSRVPTEVTNEVLMAAIEGFEAQKKNIDARIADLRQMLFSGSVETGAAAETAKRGRRKIGAAVRARIAESQPKQLAVSLTASQPSPLKTELKLKRTFLAAGEFVAGPKKSWKLKSAEAVEV